MSSLSFARTVTATAIVAALSSCSGGHALTPQVPSVSSVPQSSHVIPGASSQHKIRYRLFVIGTFGGPVSSLPVINSTGVVEGWAATTVAKLPASHPIICGGLDGVVPLITRAFKFEDGSFTDLGALRGGKNCSIPLAINSYGDSVGISENGSFDRVVGINQSRAALWKNGRIVDLGSFGGGQNAALSINDAGQVVGNSLNTVSDSHSMIDGLAGNPNGTQTRAFLWQNGKLRDLGTLGGSDADALFINQRGQIVGISYPNDTPNPATGSPPIEPFIWENGRMRDLGTLGGADAFESGINNRGEVIGGSSDAANPGACGFLNFGDPDCHPFLWDRGRLIDLKTTASGGQPIDAMAINDRGEIVGGASFPNSPRDAYVWKNGVIRDLGHLEGDCTSEAFGINARGQIIGSSYACGPDGKPVLYFNNHHAVLWDHGCMIDLNNVIPPNSGFEFVTEGPASDVTNPAINDRGEIVGIGVLRGTPPGEAETQGRAFLLVPNGNVRSCNES